MTLLDTRMSFCTRMLKSILRVGMTVCNEFMYIELKSVSMVLSHRTFSTIKNQIMTLFAKFLFHWKARAERFHWQEFYEIQRGRSKNSRKWRILTIWISFLLVQITPNLTWSLLRCWWPNCKFLKIWKWKLLKFIFSSSFFQYFFFAFHKILVNESAQP